MAKYDLEFKKKVVSEYLTGNESLRSLAKKHNIPAKRTIEQWVHNYKTYGLEGLKRSRKNASYSIELKLEAIKTYETSEKSYQDICDELDINNLSLISTWRKQYHENGIDGLSRTKGRPPLKENKKQKPVELASKETNEELETAKKRIKELEYALELEQIKNEYLEQLRSLRRQKAMKTKQESSTNSEKDTH